MHDLTFKSDYYGIYSSIMTLDPELLDNLKFQGFQLLLSRVEKKKQKKQIKRSHEYVQNDNKKKK